MVNNIKFELFTVCSGFDLLDPKSSMRVRHLKRGPCTIREALQMKKKHTDWDPISLLGKSLKTNLMVTVCSAGLCNQSF